MQTHWNDYRKKTARENDPRGYLEWKISVQKTMAEICREELEKHGKDNRPESSKKYKKSKTRLYRIEKGIKQMQSELINLSQQKLF